MFLSKTPAGSPNVGKDGRITISIDIRKFLHIDDGKDDAVFSICEINKNEFIITMERGEKKWV